MLTACGRVGYDRLPIGMGGSGGGVITGAGGAGGGAAGNGGSPGTGGSSGTGGSGGSGGSGGTGGSAGSGGTGTGGAPDFDASSGNEASAPNTNCSQAGAPIQSWSFDTTVEGWELSGTGTMVWTGAVGDPAAGAIQVDWNGGQTIHPRLVQPLGDLRGRIITAEIWLDSGANATVKVFVQTGTRQVWADGGVVTLTAGQWTCLALDIDNPAFRKAQYDPTDVEILGFELLASGPSRIYFDQVAY